MILVDCLIDETGALATEFLGSPTTEFSSHPRARFLRFHQLTDALSTAVAVNYYVGDDEKSLEEFIKNNGLNDMSSEEICEIIKLYEDHFRLLEYKAKEEMMKRAENEFVGEQ